MKNIYIIIAVLLLGSHVAFAGEPKLRVWCTSVLSTDAVLRAFTANAGVDKPSYSTAASSRTIVALMDKLSESNSVIFHSTFIDGLPVEISIPRSEEKIQIVTSKNLFRGKIVVQIDYVFKDGARGSCFISEYEDGEGGEKGIRGVFQTVPRGANTLIFACTGE